MRASWASFGWACTYKANYLCCFFLTFCPLFWVLGNSLTQNVWHNLCKLIVLAHSEEAKTMVTLKPKPKPSVTVTWITELTNREVSHPLLDLATWEKNVKPQMSMRQLLIMEEARCFLTTLKKHLNPAVIVHFQQLGDQQQHKSEWSAETADPLWPTPSIHPGWQPPPNLPWEEKLQCRSTVL